MRGFVHSPWIYTMPRCFSTDAARSHPLAAPVLALMLSALTVLPASAQYAAMARVLPTDTLRGALVVGVPPEATLNKQPIRLAPGVRIRGSNNMLMLSGEIGGFSGKVNYRLETGTGLLKEIWVLTDTEASALWPTTPQEAATWVYDPIALRWTKP